MDKETLKKYGIGALAVLVLAGAAMASADYRMTAEQMTELEQVFQGLRNQQEEQSDLLNQQAEQLTTLQKKLNESQAQIGTLNYQLRKARSSIDSSQAEMKTFQSSLDEANESLKKSAEQAKRTQKRIKAQRTVWAVLAVAAATWAALK